MPTTGITQAATVSVGGSPISQELFNRLSEVRVELSVGAAGWFELRFSSDEPLDSTFTIGADVEISFDDARGNATSVFIGAIDSLAVDYDRSHRLLLVSGYDKRRKISTEPQARAFSNQSFGDIIQRIASDAGLSADVHSSASSPKFEHLMQVGSDIEFLHRIASRLGMEWFVDDRKLVVRPRESSGTVELEFGQDLRRFNARYTSREHPKTVEVHGWDPASKQSIVATETAAQGSPVGSVDIETNSRNVSADNRTARSWAQPIVSESDGSSIAQGYARRMASGDLVGRGETTGDPSIVPGVLCDVSGIDDNWNGTYYVTSAEHVYRGDDPYLTRFTVGAYDSSSLVDLLGPGSGGAGAGRPNASFGSGVTIGVVTNNRNSEKNFGQVKVKFPYLTDDVESAWARVATVGAGANRGVMFMPEVDDEVLVAFEHGDVTRPYVIGSVWNGNDAPPLARHNDEEAMKKRTIVSRLGHQLTFYDGDGDDKKNVSIVLADGATKLFLGHDKVEVIANSGKPIEVKNDKARLVLAANGDITLA
ncbi:MAG: VgrG-related protein, partial [Ilumatobacteraceae bacterium]